MGGVHGPLHPKTKAVKFAPKTGCRLLLVKTGIREQISPESARLKKVTTGQRDLLTPTPTCLSKWLISHSQALFMQMAQSLLGRQSSPREHCTCAPPWRLASLGDAHKCWQAQRQQLKHTCHASCRMAHPSEPRWGEPHLLEIPVANQQPQRLLLERARPQAGNTAPGSSRSHAS